MLRDKIAVKFIAIAASFLVLLTVVGGTAAFTYSSVLNASSQQAPVGAPGDTAKNPQGNLPSADPGSSLQPAATINPKANLPAVTTAMILGTDKSGALTDVIFLVVYDSVYGKISVISVPRDTYTKISEAEIKAIKNSDRYVPSSGVMKLNELHSYAGTKDGYKYTRKQLESMFGVKINYYAKVNIQAFRNIVDAVGGIYMNVRAKGYDYEDPYQNLKIHVPGGYQRLDGKLAEGVVRFRNDYPDGDLDRIEVQHEFMKEFFSQALSKEAVMKNPRAFFSNMVSYVSTDFGIADISDYLPALQDLKADSIDFYTAPGEFEDIYQGDKHISYFKVDTTKSVKLIGHILTKNANPDASAEPSASTTPKTNYTSKPVSTSKPATPKPTYSHGTTGAATAEPESVTTKSPVPATQTTKPSATKSPLPAATQTAKPVASKSPVPAATQTAEPVATKSPLPAATQTAKPVATKSPVPAATQTAKPVATKSPLPAETQTAEPVATNSPKIVSVQTSKPSETKSAEPKETQIPEPVMPESAEPAKTQTAEPPTTN